MQHIVPHLWFDTQAKEAAEFYTSIFKNARITHSAVLHDTPSGDAELISFEIAEQPFMAISAGPYFKINPSISFMLNFDPSRDEDAEAYLNELWEKLSTEGMTLMPLGEYPFSKRYGWIEDKYGVSWQLILTDPEGEPRPFIIPSMLFVGEACGRAEEAVNFYTSVFTNSKVGTIARYPAGMEPEKEGTIMFSDFILNKQWFAAMDSAHNHEFAFNEGVSLLVECDTQEEIDYYWNKLSAVPEAEQCGWLKDAFGVSWQISATLMKEYLASEDSEAAARVTKAMLQMKKIDIETLRRAYAG